eukprot:58638_1
MEVVYIWNLKPTDHGIDKKKKNQKWQQFKIDCFGTRHTNRPFNRLKLIYIWRASPTIDLSTMDSTKHTAPLLPPNNGIQAMQNKWRLASDKHDTNELVSQNIVKFSVARKFYCLVLRSKD